MQKIFIGLTLIVCCLTQSCNSQTGDKSKSDGEQVNKQAPFYSKQLPTGSQELVKSMTRQKLRVTTLL